MTWRAAFCWIAGGTPTNPGRSRSGTGDQPGNFEAAGTTASGMACCKGITPQVIGRCVRYPALGKLLAPETTQAWRGKTRYASKRRRGEDPGRAMSGKPYASVLRNRL